MAAESVDRRVDCDVLIIGGGVNGSGLARDLSLRGLRVVLVERNDLGFGASGNSSGMIHGGPRYLTNDPEVTRSSCEDSGYIQRIAQHMVFRVPFIVPVYGKGVIGRAKFEAFDAFFAVYDKFQELKRGKPHARLTADDADKLVPGIVTKELHGAITFDEWGIDGVRLCVVNAIDAIENGAEVLTHTTVEKVTVVEGKATGARVRDRLTGRAATVEARAVVNCTGAWGPITAGLAGLDGTVKIRPGKGVHLVLDRAITDVAVRVEAVDGREMFIEPWGNTSIIGTTDDDTYDDLDDLPVTVDEVRYLIEGVERVLPRVRHARVIATTVGARPTIHEWGKNEDDLSRRHAVLDHAQDGVSGMWSLVGGKLASYRAFAQEAADVVAPWLGNHKRCSTHSRPLPGGEREVDIDAFALEHGLSRWAADKLVSRHGTRAAAVIGEGGPRGKVTVCRFEPVMAAEVKWVARNESVRTLEDIARRTRLGLGACGGSDCALAGATIAAEVLGWGPAEVRDQAARLIEARRKSRLPGMGAQQARAEAITDGALRALGRGARR